MFIYMKRDNLFHWVIIIVAVVCVYLQSCCLSLNSVSFFCSWFGRLVLTVDVLLRSCLNVKKLNVGRMAGSDPRSHRSTVS